MSKLQSSANQITVRKNTGGNVGTRGRLNFIEGTNVTLTVADDAGNNEVDITITAAGGGGGGSTAWLDQFFPAVDTSAHKGTYATIPMLDGVTTNIYQTVMIPAAIVTVTRAVVIVISEASGNIYWNCDTNYGQICSGEDFQTHVWSKASAASAIVLNEVDCLSIASILSAASGGDIVGINFVRSGGNASDTISNTVHYLGVLIQGTT